MLLVGVNFRSLSVGEASGFFLVYPAFLLVLPRVRRLFVGLRLLCGAVISGFYKELFAGLRSIVAILYDLRYTGNGAISLRRRGRRMIVRVMDLKGTRRRFFLHHVCVFIPILVVDVDCLGGLWACRLSICRVRGCGTLSCGVNEVRIGSDFFGTYPASVRQYGSARFVNCEASFPLFFLRILGGVLGFRLRCL